MDSALTASFQYDEVERERSKTVGNTARNFLYDGLNVVQELNGTTPVANLLTGLGIDEVLVRTESTGALTFLTDILGSTIALADSTGTIQTQYSYEPFGRTLRTSASSSNAFKFTGREDDATKMYYFRVRYYHPELHRFIATDPLGFWGGDVNLYSYVSNNPVNFIDPFGFFTEVIAWDGVGNGRSSFGHASVHINGTSFSFGHDSVIDSVMYIQSIGDYLGSNGFRRGLGMQLNLTPDQEAAFENSLRNYNRTYWPWGPNCTDPIQQGLNGLGYGVSPSIWPSDLRQNLLGAGLIKGVQVYTPFK